MNQVRMKNKHVDVVMLIDDNEIDGFINQKVLEFNNFAEEILIYYSGREALDFLGTLSVEEFPDVIFLDLNMPVVDGFRFLFEFANFPEEVRKKTKIVVLTSSDNTRDKEKVMVNPDVLHFVSKPLNEVKLEAVRDMISNV